MIRKVCCDMVATDFLFLESWEYKNQFSQMAL